MDELFRKVEEIIRRKYSEEPGVPVSDTELLSPEELSDGIALKVGEQGLSEPELVELLEKVYHHSIRTGSVYFMNQMFGSVQKAAWLADILLPVFNTSVYTYEVAPVFTLMEREVIAALSVEIWGKEGDGVFTGGGSLSNMYAMYLSLIRASEQWRKTGVAGAPPYAVFVSDQAHYSFTKGVSFLGLGEDALYPVPSGGDSVITAKALEETIERSMADGRKPLMVTAIAGTTKSGSIDPLEEIAEVAERFGLWYHVDAAFGGAQLFHPEYRNKLKGIERADSVIWNFHKVMGMPLSTSSFLVRRQGLLNGAFSVEADYLFHDEDSRFDLGQKSLRGGRRPDVFKLWLMWKYAGKKGLSQHVERLQRSAEDFSRMIDSHPEMELYATPATSIVCFRYKPPHIRDGRELDKLNVEIRTQIVRKGKMLFNYTRIRGNIYLRTVVLNPEIEERHFRHIIDTVVETAHKVLNPVS